MNNDLLMDTVDLLSGPISFRAHKSENEIESNIVIECISCHNEFRVHEIEYANHPISYEINDVNLFYDFADEVGLEIDCPICGDVMYVTDCGIY